MKKYIETYYKGLINGLGFLTVIGLTGVAYGAYVAMTDVTTGQTLTAATFNQVLENQRVIKSTVDGHTTTLSGLSNIPAGFVGAFNLSSCPTGWIAANGASGTPDLRGEFIRGLDSGRGVDVARTLASAQADIFKSHNHTATSDVQGNHTHTGLDANRGTSGGLYGLVDSNSANSSGIHSLGYAGSHSHNITVNSNGGTETRPRNVALLYCVKQ